MKFTNIHLPVALVLLLALEHHQQHHLLLGVHLLQDLLLQQHLQKGLWVHDEELLSDQTVPTCKLNFSRLLRCTTKLLVVLDSHLTA